MKEGITNAKQSLSCDRVDEILESAWTNWLKYIPLDQQAAGLHSDYWTLLKFILKSINQSGQMESFSESRPAHLWGKIILFTQQEIIQIHQTAALEPEKWA